MCVKKELFLAAGVFVCGILLWDWVSFTHLGLGVTAFVVFLCVVTVLYCKFEQVKFSRKSLVCMALLLFSAAQFSIFDGRKELEIIHFLLTGGLYVYFVAETAGRLMEPVPGAYVLADAVNQIFSVPFKNFKLWASAVAAGGKGSKSGKVMAISAGGLLLFLPVLVIVVGLLGTADVNFQQLVFKAVGWVSVERVSIYLLEIVFAIPVAMYLYGLIYGNVHNGHGGDITKDSIDRAAMKVRFLPGAAVYSGLGVLNGIYLLFCFVQSTYLFAALRAALPGSLTYAAYARDGFFQLCAVVAINFLVMTGSYLVIKRGQDKKTSPAFRIQTGLLCLFTLVLIITAFSKMLLYVNAYGLTPYRVYPMCVMALLFVIFLTVGARQIVRFPAAKIMIGACLIIELAVSYGNVDGNIAKYNIDQYEKKTLETLDTEVLFDLTDGAVPYILNLYRETEDEELKTKLKQGLTMSADRETIGAGFLSDFVSVGVKENTFRTWNRQSEKASQIIEKVRNNEL